LATDFEEDRPNERKPRIKGDKRVVVFMYGISIDPGDCCSRLAESRGHERLEDC